MSAMNKHESRQPPEQQTRSSIFDILKRKSKFEMDEIYDSSLTSDNILAMSNQSVWACKAIFQSLSMQGKCYVMKAFPLNASFSLKEIDLWAAAGSMREHNVAIDELSRLWIFVDVDDTDGLKMEFSAIEFNAKQEEERRSKRRLKLNDCFRRSLQQAIVSPEEPWAYFLQKIETAAAFEGVANTMRAPSTAALDKFSAEKWEEMLGFLVGIIPKNSSTRLALQDFAVRSKLMDISPKGQKLTITKLGYEYMLKDYHNQVWDFVYSSMPDEHSNELLMLLFMLAYCEVGKGYPVEALTIAQQKLIGEFAALGIVYWPSKQHQLFYPTHMAVNMIFGAATTSSSTDSNSSSSSAPAAATVVSSVSAKRLTVVVETNMQVLAYLTSDIHLAMLDLFVEVHVRMPNMAVGRITRDKSKAAFAMGISAAQIIDFLTAHAHSCIASRSPVLPGNVVDQLALWEEETSRVRMQSAVMIDFKDVLELRPIHNVQEVFKDLCDNLQHAEVLLWRDGNPSRMLFCVTPDGVQAVTDFLEVQLNFTGHMDND